MSRSRRVRLMVVGLAMTVAATAGITIYNAPHADTALPDGWIRAGSAPNDFDMGTDAAVVRGGKASGFLQSKVAKPAGFGTLMQMCKGEALHGKRLRMSAWVKAENVADWAGLWMRVDGHDSNRPLAFDNMQSRPIKGTADWKQYEIVLDVPSEAKNLAYGILLSGTGHVWLDDMSFEAVDASVQTTGASTGVDLAAAPSNLNFED